jgi:hypothetical protein
VLVELGECCWVEGDIVDCMLRIVVEYLASAEKNDVAAFACWLEGLRLVPPFSSCGLVLYLDSRTTYLHSTATAKRRPLTTSSRTRIETATCTSFSLCLLLDQHP